jgi:aminoglycoside 3-N-acetyltransferase
MPTEHELIAGQALPITPGQPVQSFRALGLGDGAIVMVHTSMSQLGWIIGDAQTVVESLLEAVGSTGTIVMPAHSGRSDPARWQNPPVEPAWVEMIRAEVPAFDRSLTPTRGMGQVVDCFLRHPDTQRSGHPTVSFAANGHLATDIVEPHVLSPSLGEESPLGRLYDLGAKVLLLGVGHDNNTSLHLAEYRASWPHKTFAVEGAAVLVGGIRTWVAYEDLDLHEEDFVAIGDAYSATKPPGERTSAVGIGIGRLYEMRPLVDFAVDWITQHRR